MAISPLWPDPPGCTHSTACPCSLRQECGTCSLRPHGTSWTGEQSRHGGQELWNRIACPLGHSDVQCLHLKTGVIMQLGSQGRGGTYTGALYKRACECTAPSRASVREGLEWCNEGRAVGKRGVQGALLRGLCRLVRRKSSWPSLYVMQHKGTLLSKVFGGVCV